MTSPRVSRHAVTFALITVFLDMVGFGIIMPVLPKLIEDVGHMDLAQASIIGGWMFVAFSRAICLQPPHGQPVRPLWPAAASTAGDLWTGVDFLFSALAPTLFWLFEGRCWPVFAGRPMSSPMPTSPM